MMIESAGVKKRITLEDVKNEILNIHYFTAKEGAQASKVAEQIKNDDEADLAQWVPDSLEQLTFCVLILRNGTKIVGVNHGAIDPAQHSAEKGREEAYKDAENKIWELLGFRLRDKLADTRHPMVNLAVAFHCEGGETFDHVNRIPLSMSTLDNDRFLFMSQEKNEWLPTHLDLTEYSLYKITYELPSKVKVFDSFHEYHDLFYFNESTNKHMASPILQKYIDEGYGLFVLGENDKGELKECFLINPKDYVRGITLISF